MADQLVLRQDGQVRMKIENVTYNLRRPKLREYRDLRESLVSDDDQEAIDLLAGGDEAVAAFTAKVARREERLRREDDLIAWWRGTVKTLGKDGETLPDDDDDLPAWFLADNLIGDMLGHWRDRPAAPGA